MADGEIINFDDAEVSMSATTSTTGANTPTHTTFSDDRDENVDTLGYLGTTGANTPTHTTFSDDRDENVDTLGYLGTTGANTPTHTTFSDDRDENVDTLGYLGTSPSNDIPWPGSSYIIRSCLHHHILTLSNGNLNLKDHLEHGAGWKWECVGQITDGWLGFRNTASGAYLGHDGRGKLQAKKFHHKGWESFCARKCPGDGYLLLSLHSAWVLRKTNSDLMVTEMNGTQDEVSMSDRWDFAKV